MSTPPTGRTRSTRLIEHSSAARRLAWTIPDVWLRGILAGAEAVLGTWLLVIIPAIAAYVATAASPQLGAASWIEASQIGTGVWLAGHGATLVAGDVTFSLIPLGVSLVAIGLTSFAIRRARLTTWAAVAFAWGTYLVGTALFAKLAGVPGAYGALGGSAVILALGTARGLRGRYPRTSARVAEPLGVWWARVSANSSAWVNRRANPDRLRGLLAQARLALRTGAAGALRALTTMLALSAFMFLVAVVLTFPIIRGVHNRLDMDVVSGVVATGAQLLLIPTLVIWAMAYLAGPGFSVGSGTSFAPAEVVTGPLPAVPILGALPAPESVLTQHAIYGYGFLIVGALLGVFLHRRIRGTLVTTLSSLLVAAALSATGAGILASLASGGFGPERFASDVGPAAGAVMWAVAWKLAAAGGVIVIGFNPQTHAGVRTAYGWARELVRRRVGGGAASAK